MGFDTSQTGGSAGSVTTMPRPETIDAVGFATHGMVLENGVKPTSSAKAHGC